jgi:hypothetical protein
MMDLRAVEVVLSRDQNYPTCEVVLVEDTEIHLLH